MPGFTSARQRTIFRSRRPTYEKRGVVCCVEVRIFAPPAPPLRFEKQSVQFCQYNSERSGQNPPAKLFAERDRPTVTCERAVVNDGDLVDRVKKHQTRISRSRKRKASVLHHPQPHPAPTTTATTATAMIETGIDGTRPPPWRLFGLGFPVRRMIPSLGGNNHTAPLVRLKVLQSSSASSASSSAQACLDHHDHHNTSYSTVGESASISSTASNEPHCEGRHVRFASTLELEIQILPPPPDKEDDDLASSSSLSCRWYSRAELEQMEQERRLELDALSALASSRGLAAYRRRAGDNRAFGRVLYRLLLRFRHDGITTTTPAHAYDKKEDEGRDEEEQEEDDEKVAVEEHGDDNDDNDNDNDNDESFAIDRADFKLLQRYIARNALVTGMERNVTESVASETRALIGNVQQSVLMVQAMLLRQKGVYPHAHVDECLRCASIRYSAPSQRFARALGEVHSRVVNASPAPQQLLGG
jgi:hypothetical protein